MTRNQTFASDPLAPTSGGLRKGLGLVVGLLLLSVSGFAQQRDLTQLSLDDLMNVKVTSVSKKEQRLSRTASAIFVISSEDIRRSGATNIPDLLRMVPGVDVAQIDANTWAISARGLNGHFTNELLVVVDGRNVYTPTFGGVLWDTLDLPLEDIERIEVIRGPGGTIWGANAVNGVINIISKIAAETHGGMVVAGGGNLDKGFGTIQYGSGLGQSTDYRLYTKYFNQDHLPELTGANGGDGWHLLQGGFRTDSKLSPNDTLTVQGKLPDRIQVHVNSFKGISRAEVKTIGPSSTQRGQVQITAPNFDHILTCRMESRGMTQPILWTGSEAEPAPLTPAWIPA